MFRVLNFCCRRVRQKSLLSLSEWKLWCSFQQGSVIESSANLGIHGQGLLKLSGPGDSLRAQRLFLSLFYTVHVSDESVRNSVLGNIFQELPNELLLFLYVLLKLSLCDAFVKQVCLLKRLIWLLRLLKEQ